MRLSTHFRQSGACAHRGRARAARQSSSRLGAGWSGKADRGDDRRGSYGPRRGPFPRWYVRFWPHAAALSDGSDKHPGVAQARYARHPGLRRGDAGYIGNASRIQLNPLRISFADLDGRPIAVDDPELGMGFSPLLNADGQRVIDLSGPGNGLQAPLPGERYFGCGERTGRLEKTHFHQVFWNLDPAGDITSSLTIYTPRSRFLFRSRTARRGVCSSMTPATLNSTSLVSSRTVLFRCDTATSSTTSLVDLLREMWWIAIRSSRDAHHCRHSGRLATTRAAGAEDGGRGYGHRT